MTQSASNSTNPTRRAPLTGIRVLDLSRVLAGPWCTQNLADLGADVIKVERPKLGDDTRAWGPPYLKDENGEDTTEAAYYLSTNRNKRSIEIDLASAEGTQLVKELAKHLIEQATAVAADAKSKKVKSATAKAVVSMTAKTAAKMTMKEMQAA